ncbi:MAG: nuclear transport factor 2 family protein [Acidobacteriota bacterium]
MKTLCAFVLMSGLVLAQTAKPSLEARVQRLEDMEAIRTLLLDYGRTLDARDLKAYSELFTKDGEWIGGFGSVKGRPELLAFMQKNMGPGQNTGKTYHLLTNFFINVTGDTATAVSRWSYVVGNGDKKPQLEHSGRYEDVIVREDGRWKFRKRVVFNDLPPVEQPGR